MTMVRVPKLLWQAYQDVLEMAPARVGQLPPELARYLLPDMSPWDTLSATKLVEAALWANLDELRDKIAKHPVGR